MLVTQTRVVAGGDEKWSDAEQILKAEPETCTRPSDEGFEGRGGGTCKCWGLESGKYGVALR